MKRSSNQAWYNGVILVIALTLNVLVGAYTSTNEPSPPSPPLPYGLHNRADATTISSKANSADGEILYIDDDWDTFAGYFDATIHAPCTDVRPNCVTWAHQGRCSTDAVYMHSHCPVACHVCHERVIFQTSRLGDSVPPLHLDSTAAHASTAAPRAFGWHTLTASAIEYDAVYVPGLGPESVAQRLVVGHEEWIEECVQQLSDWAVSPTTKEETVDTNLYHKDCLYFVVATEACQTEADQAFMSQNCAVACHVCHIEERVLPTNQWTAEFVGELL
jgi:ShK domain-like